MAKTKYVDTNTGEIFTSPGNVIKGCDYALFGHPMDRYKKLVYKWRVRLSLEAKHSPSVFVTFTYNQENYPKDGIPDIRDWQLFMKKLRRSLDYYNIKAKVKYFVVSEYGEKGRLHLHAILFGLPYNAMLEKFLIRCWNKGYIKVKPTKQGAVGYVLKYMMKHAFEPHLKTQSQGLGTVEISVYKDYCIEHKTNVIRLGGYSYFLGSFLMRKILGDSEYLSFQDLTYNRIAGQNSAYEMEQEEQGRYYYLSPFTDDDGQIIPDDDGDIVPVERISATAFKHQHGYEIRKQRYENLMNQSLFAMEAKQLGLTFDYFKDLKHGDEVDR